MFVGRFYRMMRRQTLAEIRMSEEPTERRPSAEMVELDSKASLPPARSPPRPPSILPLPLVPQTPAAYALSVEPTQATFTAEGGVSK